MQNHYLNDQSENKYISTFFAKKSQGSASYGSRGEPTEETESQRGFVPLSEGGTSSNAFAGKARPSTLELGSGEDIEMQGDENTCEVIHVRSDMSVAYSA